MSESYAYGIWLAVAINAAIFIFFVVSFLRPRGHGEWRSMGTFSAFVVALFTEMYGFPLTIYLLTSLLGSQYPVTNPFSHLSGNLWAVLAGGSSLASAVFMAVGGALMLAGLFIMGRAWRQIYQANGDLVTSGLYKRVRHPQYSALILITIGMLIQWPTVITLAMWPILMFMYYRLAQKEERQMEARFNDKYLEYKRQVPMFLPLGQRQMV
ncbi:MAG: isoprenylcysteine carboxylmethyltransferase family protein [Chloroflexi bacterium]|nr:isoprenylcysteine carboxylmethyltransferase family protein [Chloroflexota bacterium]